MGAILPVDSSVVRDKVCSVHEMNLSQIMRVPIIAIDESLHVSVTSTAALLREFNREGVTEQKRHRPLPMRHSHHYVRKTSKSLMRSETGQVTEAPARCSHVSQTRARVGEGLLFHEKLHSSSLAATQPYLCKRPQ